jgi:hypothetical protein
MKNFLIFLILFLAFVLYALKVPDYYPKNIQDDFPKDFFGVTYSKKYAERLGLDWREAYIEILEDLNVKKVRIPIYWDEVETVEGEFNFEDYYYLIEEGEKRGVEFILTFGMRVPRWPECHIPSWVNMEDKNVLQEKTARMIEAVMDSFKKYDSIAYWQVENEPLLNTFGVCPKADYNFLKKEVELVKSIDDRPVIVSATGELGLWSREVKISDIFGTTMYRVVKNSYLSYIKYPYSHSFYTNKAKILKADFDKVFIVELQAEPWLTMDEILDVNSLEHLKSFSIDQFKANAQVAYNTGFERAYFWGVEWWYFRYKKANDPSYWNLAKTFFN